MATAGDQLVNTVTGLRTVFRATAGDTNGELLRVEWIGAAGWTTGPDHVHPLQEERYDGRTTAAGIPRDPLRTALILREFSNEIVFVRPPPAVQRAVLGPLAAIARRLGYRADYPYPYDEHPNGIVVGERA